MFNLEFKRKINISVKGLNLLVKYWCSQMNEGVESISKLKDQQISTESCRKLTELNKTLRRLAAIWHENMTLGIFLKNLTLLRFVKDSYSLALTLSFYSGMSSYSKKSNIASSSGRFVLVHLELFGCYYFAIVCWSQRCPDFVDQLHNLFRLCIKSCGKSESFQLVTALKRVKQCITLLDICLRD